MRHAAHFAVVHEDSDMLVIRDVSPWDRRATVTNDVENVVPRLRLNGRRLFYFDSENVLDEIVVKNGKFAGFAPLTGQALKDVVSRMPEDRL